MPRLGLVKVLALEGRGHAYGVGFVPSGEFISELGALESEPGADRAPVWLTSDGALVLGAGWPGSERASLLRRLRWVLAPLRWRRPFRAQRRLALMAWRLRRLRTPAPLRTDPTDQLPAGYLCLEPVDGKVPLFEGIHPITADQLLATDMWEVNDPGYGMPRVLGYIHPSAPLTGVAAGRRPLLRWASRQGQLVRSHLWHRLCPGGNVEEPLAGTTVERLPMRVSGWAMLPSEPVTHVEITLDGRAAGRARLGLHRPDLAAACACANAPIAGWECALGAHDGLPDIGTVTIGAVAYGGAGGKVVVPGVTVHMANRGRTPRLAAGDVLALTRAGRQPNGNHRAPSIGVGRRLSPPAEDLNVLVFMHSLSYGGAQLYLVELMERLSQLRLRMTVVSAYDGPLRDRLERLGAAVHVSPAPSPWQPDLYDARVAELTSWAAPQSFDLAIVNTITVFHGLEVAARLGLPSILAVHESLDPVAYWTEHLAPQDPRILDRLARALRYASIMVFEAEATRELFLPYADAERLLTMPYGIDLAAINRFRSAISRDAARRAVRIGEDKALVLCLGTIEPRKSQASLARAFASVAKQHPDAMLVLVGQVDDAWSEHYRAGITQHLFRAGLLDRVRVAPLTPNPFEWHVAADVLVCPSDNESLPRVILEAMAFETVVVATDVFGIPEVVEDGVTGFRCRSRDERELAQTLTNVLAKRSQHRAIVSAAAERVRRRHDADAYAARFEELVYALVDGRSPAHSLKA